MKRKRKTATFTITTKASLVPNRVKYRKGWVDQGINRSIVSAPPDAHQWPFPISTSIVSSVFTAFDRNVVRFGWPSPSGYAW